MSNLWSSRADITIDNGRAWPGKIQVEQEIITYSTASATKPDPSWTLTDAAGHFHAYDDDGELPTLEARTRHVDCDGVHTGPMLDPHQPCEGYDVVDYHCRICLADVEPKRLSDAGEKSMPGLKHWSAEFTTDETRYDGQTVSVRALTADGLHFGTAYARMVKLEHEIGGRRATYELSGASPLGFRRHRS